MALATIGTLVVELTNENQQPRTETLHTIMKCGAAYVGGVNKPAIMDTAREGVNDGIDFINMKKFFRFARIRQISVPLVEGESTITLPSNFFAVDDVMLLDAETEVSMNRLDFMESNQFNLDYRNRIGGDGEPRFWTAFNTFDSGVIEIWPIPDEKAATNVKLQLSIYERILAPNDDSEVIDAPREMNSVLCWYAKFYCSMIQNGADHPKTMAAWEHFDTRLTRFSISTKRQPSHRKQEIIAVDHTRANRRGFRDWRFR